MNSESPTHPHIQHVALTENNSSVLLNFGRTEKMLAVCGGKTNILPTSFQRTIHKEPMFSPAPHLLGGVNVERMLIESEWLIYEWARCGEFLRTPLKVPVS